MSDAEPTPGAAGACAAPSRLERLATLVEQALPGQLTRVASHTGELTYEVRPAQLIQVATALRDREGLQFQMCMDVCGVDYLQHGRAEWKTEQATLSGFSRGVARAPASGAAAPGAIGPGAAAPGGLSSAGLSSGGDSTPGRRFAVVYHLLSIAHNHRVRLRVYCEDDGHPAVDSVTGVWAAADWFEREAFDLFGILFRGHPDLRRILTDYGFIGHPFRKDFPLSGNVEVRYDPEKRRVVYQAVSIEPRVLVPKVIRHDNRYDPALSGVPATSLEPAAPQIVPPPAPPAPAKANG
ncbi:MAG TPA: NADH-quinone oxidoreductase subunit C [Steroidobacteraceae bacterium]|nr:NADH-quinone oxidoreductase subunit C [Steroidobacteraceae bacterium]